jgi:hypothetical protein
MIEEREPRYFLDPITRRGELINEPGYRWWVGGHDSLGSWSSVVAGTLAPGDVITPAARDPWSGHMLPPEVDEFRGPNGSCAYRAFFEERLATGRDDRALGNTLLPWEVD